MLDIKRYGLVAAGVIIGMAGGYLYWEQVGCMSGSCPITSNAGSSTLYGAVIGGLLFSMFRKEKKGDQ